MVDKIACEFTRLFYENVMEEQFICDAFHNAKKTLLHKYSADKQLVDMIIIMPDHYAKEGKRCQHRIILQDGKMNCLTNHTLMQLTPERSP